MSVVPTFFRFLVGRTQSAAYRVELVGEVLRCGTGNLVISANRDTDGDDDRDKRLNLAPSDWDDMDREFVPNREQWIEFRERLDAMGAFDWQEEYVNPAILDGWDWSLKVTYPDVEIVSGGLNGFPDTDGAFTDSKNQGFRSLVRALRELSGCQRIEEMALGDSPPDSQS